MIETTTSNEMENVQRQSISLRSNERKRDGPKERENDGKMHRHIFYFLAFAEKTDASERGLLFSSFCHEEHTNQKEKKKKLHPLSFGFIFAIQRLNNVNKWDEKFKWSATYIVIVKSVRTKQ